MRKRFCWIFGMCLILSLSACGELEESQEDGSSGQGDSAQIVQEETIDLSHIFQGKNGCAVLYSPGEDKYRYYQRDLCAQEASPFSTFKIISTLIGLQHGVVNDETSTMQYSGERYPNPKWNGNLTLQEAFQSSCIWYFRQVIDGVGQEVVEQDLQSLHYGNCDITQWEGSGVNPSGELNGFWLDSSLKISPLGRVQVLSHIFEGQSDFSPAHVEIVKKLLLVEDSGANQIYGKTGSGGDRAWCVGFAEEGGTREYFAIYFVDDMGASGEEAKEMALTLYKE